MRVTLLRTEFGLSETLGILMIDGGMFYTTLEPPWRDNRQSVSCVPEGHYKCKRYDSPKYGSVFEVLDIPIRANIVLGHIGNTHRDTTGCIILGLYSGVLNYTRAVMESRRACAGWKVVTDGIDELDLTIMSIKKL